MKNNELVSIIIPCYDQAQYLEEAVQSAIEQTYPNIEIIIVNDGSPDNTQEVAERLQKQHPEKIHIVTQENMGLSEARNSGINQATGKYILPFDADDLIDKDMVSLCINAMEESNSDIVFTGYRRFGIMGGTNIGKPFSDNDFLFIAPYGPQSIYKRIVWKNIGGYKQNMKGSYEDWEFCMNAYKHGFKIHYLEKILYSYRKKEESLWTKAYKQHDYAKSKIVLNHPELYLKYHVLEAVEMIRNAEELSDLYFYHDEKLSISEKKLKNILSNYLNKHSLKDKHIIENDDLDIGLFNLEILDNKKSISKLYKRNNLNFIIFYAPMRYTVSLLTTCDFAWDRDDGIVEAHGTIFPFVFRAKREKPELQSIAYKRLRRHLENIPEDLKEQLKHWQKENRQMHNKMIGQADLLERRKDLMDAKDDLLERRKDLIHDKDDLLERRKDLIHAKDDLLERQKILIDTQTDTIQAQEQLSKLIGNITKISILKSPLQKYKAYKDMLLYYAKNKKSRR